MDKYFGKLMIALPFINLCIGTSALTIQVFLLHWWHSELDKSHFKVAKRLEEYQNNLDQRIGALEYKVQKRKD
jgi:hypothetical protein